MVRGARPRLPNHDTTDAQTDRTRGSSGFSLRAIRCPPLATRRPTSSKPLQPTARSGGYVPADQRRIRTKHRAFARFLQSPHSAARLGGSRTQSCLRIGADTMANTGAATSTAEQLVPAGCDLFNDQEWLAVCDRLQLSSRQAEVVVRVICGQGDRAIANSLGISSATVRAHLHRVFESLEVTDRVSLLVRVFGVLRSFDR